MNVNNVICTKASIKKIYKSMIDFSICQNEAKAISKASSLHPVPVSVLCLNLQQGYLDLCRRSLFEGIITS